MMNLSQMKCVPCQGGMLPLPLDRIEVLKSSLHPDWKLTHDNTHLNRAIKTKDFIDAMKLANIVGEIAEEEGHHPELHVGWGHIDIEVWTHKINNLVENDFIFAAKVDAACREFLY